MMRSRFTGGPGRERGASRTPRQRRGPDGHAAGTLVQAADRLDSGEDLTADVREVLLEGVRGYEQGAAEQVEKPRIQLTRAEEFAATLHERLTHVPAP